MIAISLYYKYIPSLIEHKKHTIYLIVNAMWCVVSSKEKNPTCPHFCVYKSVIVHFLNKRIKNINFVIYESSEKGKENFIVWKHTQK